MYRLVTRGTYEEAILKSASRKYGLDEALLGGDSGGGEGGADPLADVARIESLLKHGVMAFSDAAVAETARFVAEGIEDILDKRAERRQVGSRKGNTFSTATFVAEEEPAPVAGVEEGGAGAAPEPGEAGASAAPTSGPEFWAAWLPDAVAREVADPHSKRQDILEGPRQRKKVDYSIKLAQSRGTAEDEAADGSDYAMDGSDSESAPASRWTHTQVQNLETFLVSFGFGSRDAAINLFLHADSGVTCEEAEEVAFSLVAMVETATEHVQAGRAGALDAAKAAAEEEEAAAKAGEAGGDEEADPELHSKLEGVQKPACARRALGSKRLTIRLKRNVARYALRLAERAALLARVTPPADHPPGSDALAFAFEVPGCGRQAPPAPWWGLAEDRDLLRGSLRHGFTPASPDLWRAQHQAIRADPQLGFAAKLAAMAAAKAAQEKEAEAAAASVRPPGFDEEDEPPAPEAAAPDAMALDEPAAAPAEEAAAAAPAAGPQLALGSTRCGRCKSCLNPKLKQACFTRKAELGPPGGGALARAPAQPGLEFWPVGAVLKKRLQKLLDGLLRPEPVKGPKEPRKRVRPARSAAGAKPGRVKRSTADKDDVSDTEEEDEDEPPAKPARKGQLPLKTSTPRPDSDMEEEEEEEDDSASPSPSASAGGAPGRTLKIKPLAKPSTMRASPTPQRAGEKAKSKVERKEEKSQGGSGPKLKQAQLSFGAKPKPPQ